MKITSKELRNKWLNFYKERGHVDIGAVSLIGDGTTGVMFNVAGMQPLMPYLLGAKHPDGTRLCNVQGCVRTVDIEEVGDESHCTFFEMMGNWSLGDYFKKEKTKWSFDLLTKEFGLNKDEICSTVFAGNESAPRDDETANLLMNLGIKKEHIFYLGKKPNGKESNWWELEGTVGTPCGPDNEWFYPTSKAPCGPNCGPECDCGRYVEIGNDVYMQYKKLLNCYAPLENKNVDTGFGFERLLMFLNGVTDVYKTDLFVPAIKVMETCTNKNYGDDEKVTRAMRIIADHIRTSVMLIGDKNGILPSNVGSGYILRRIMRRAIRYSRTIGVDEQGLVNIAKTYIEDVYNEAYPLLKEKEEYILTEISKEVQKFEKALDLGLKEFEKLLSGIERKNTFMKMTNPSFKEEKTLGGKACFRLFDTFGFPIELTKELAEERDYQVDMEGYNEAYKQHQELARTTSAGVFKGGLQDNSVECTRLHTAAHLMLAGLRSMFGDTVHQKGSNITPERLRFDVSLDRKLTDEEVKTLENFVNNAIQNQIEVQRDEMSPEKAREQGALGDFSQKYGDKVSVYTIGSVSKEICMGPHVKNTKELGKFKISKQEAVSAGVRRFKAVLEN